MRGINFLRFLNALIVVGAICGCTQQASAAYYANVSHPFAWIDPGSHTNVVWTGASGGPAPECTGGSAAIDDDITQELAIGFTFNFGGINYTTVRIQSNGRLQFNNRYCGSGTQTVGPPPTYPDPYPNGNVVRTLRVYGNDLDPTIGGASARVTYATLGAAPDRKFVATWSKVREWNAPSSEFNLQIILQENGEFIFQYEKIRNASNGKAQIGWELTTADYGMLTFTNIEALQYSAFRLYRPGAPVTPGGFNAVDVGGNPLAGVIRTKLSAQAFSLDLVALNAAKTSVEASFSGDVSVDVIANTSAGVSLDANNCPLSGTTLAVGTRTISNGRSSVTFPAVADAWRDARVRIRYPTTSPTVTACSTDNFAIRPASFAGFAATDSDSASAGSARALNNGGATGGVVHRAGRPFTLAATAVNATGSATTNYNGSPQVVLVSCLLPAGCGTGELGTLAPGSWTAAAGVVTSSTATYRNAGSFQAQLTDTSFAAVDAADSSAAERTIASSAITIGRFVPDAFVLSGVGVPQFKTFNDATCASRSFTYVGQRFGWRTAPSALLTAVDASGATTTLYRAELWKLSTASVSQSFAALPASPVFDTSLAALPAVASNGNGTGNLNAATGDLFVFTRSLTTPVTPFTAAISLTWNVSDASESAVGGNGTIAAAAPLVFNGTGAGIAFDAGAQFRYGRLRLGSAYGTDRLDLPISIDAQYWNGFGFVTNTADFCTRVAAANMQLRDYQPASFSTLVPAPNLVVGGAFNAGAGSILLRRPTSPAAGSLTLCIDLDSGASGDASCLATTPAVLGYMQGRWAGSNFDRDPSARVAFGLYRAPGNFIYFRENH